jgi:peptidylprolyl isomerase
VELTIEKQDGSLAYVTNEGGGPQKEVRRHTVDAVKQTVVAASPLHAAAVAHNQGNSSKVKTRRTVGNYSTLSTLQAHLTLVLDGYSAPLTAGNFVRNVLEGTYTNAELRVDQGAVLAGGGAAGGEAR